MYKYVSAVLLLLLLCLGVVFGYHYWQWSGDRKELKEALSKSQKMQKETETAYSRLAIENKNLKASKKDLQDVIEQRDEEVLALTQATLRLKNKTFKVDDAKESIVNKEGDEVKDSSLLKGEDKRQKVEFTKTKDELRVSGYTLTNPPFAEVTVSWVKDLKLDVILTKDKDDKYRVYVDSKNSTAVPTDISLQVDPSVLERAWYENISFGADLIFGETGAGLSLRGQYNLNQSWSLGPAFLLFYDGDNAETFYGASIGWYPWR